MLCLAGQLGTVWWAVQPGLRPSHDGSEHIHTTALSPEISAVSPLHPILLAG